MLAIASLPGLVGLSLGVIYGLGTVETVSQLHGENLHAMDWLPLIPLNQILGKGIVGALVYGLLLLLVVPLFLFMSLLLPHHRDQREHLFQKVLARIGLQDGRPIPGSIRFLFPILLVFSVAYSVYALIKAPWITWILVPILYAWLRGFHHWLSPRIGSFRASALAALAFLAVLGPLVAFMVPDRLPNAFLILRNGSHVEGALVTNTDITWYVANHGIVRVLAATSVTSATVRSAPKRGPLPSVVDLVGDVVP